jgi:triacylglycerol lipase
MRYHSIIILALVLYGCNLSPHPKNRVQDQLEIYPPADTQGVVMNTKPVPEINWKNLRPPYDWWDFFKDAELHPFRFRSTGLDMLNAWWLIEASTLVYSDPEFVQVTFARAGLPMVRFFDAKSTQCFVASNENFIIVAFRGTETRLRSKQPDDDDIVNDLMTDVRIFLVPCERGGKVHEGFKQALDAVWWDGEQEGRPIKGLKHYLDELSTQKERPVWFTGHSLGAALATLAANRYVRVQGLYSFGSPRVGDLEFKNNYRVMNFRFVNDEDIVTRLPPEAFSYRHIGNRIIIGANGLIAGTKLQMGSSEEAGKDSLGEVERAVEQTRLQYSGSIPKALLNHVPILYSTHIWNSYVQNR